MTPVLSILMPVFNEEAFVEQALERALGTDLGVPFELVVVDDGSTDRTPDILGSDRWPANVRVLRHQRNQGKGAAVRTALGAAGGDFSAILDADLEYTPEDLRLLLAPLRDGTANAVFGVRAFDGYTSHSFLYVLGNRAVTLAANLLFNVYLRDLMTMHKAMRTDLFRSLPLRARGFTIEPEIAAQLLRRGEPIFEVPVHYRARSRDEGKKLFATDGLKVIATLVRWRLAGRYEDGARR